MLLKIEDGDVTEILYERNGAYKKSVTSRRHIEMLIMLRPLLVLKIVDNIKTKIGNREQSTERNV